LREVRESHIFEKSIHLNRRNLLKASGAVFAASVMTSKVTLPSDWSLLTESSPQRLIRLSFNENPYGPSSNVAEAIQHDFARLNRYADRAAAQRLAEQIASYEHVPVEQVVLGEILGLLGLYLGSRGGPGGRVHLLDAGLSCTHRCSSTGGRYWRARCVECTTSKRSPGAQSKGE
jgi:histidinol-phosphate aminotransferase